MSSPVALILTKTDEGFEVLDSIGRSHQTSAEGLAELYDRLAEDAALPPVVIEDVETAQLEFAATELTKKFLPNGLDFFARPVVVTLRNTFKSIRWSRSSNVSR